jgi:hypothetical protein
VTHLAGFGHCEELEAVERVVLSCEIGLAHLGGLGQRRASNAHGVGSADPAAHLQEVLDGSLKLAAEEDPDEEE